jgi:hypothetical protein
VARNAWAIVSGVFGVDVGPDYESVASKWLCNKRFGVVNMVTSAVCRGIWKLRNLLCLQGVPWVSMSKLWRMVIPMLRSWSLGATEDVGWVESVLSSLEAVLARPELIS